MKCLAISILFCFLLVQGGLGHGKNENFFDETFIVFKSVTDFQKNISKVTLLKTVYILHLQKFRTIHTVISILEEKKIWLKWNWYIFSGAMYFPNPWWATSECTLDMRPDDCEYGLELPSKARPLSTLVMGRAWKSRARAGPGLGPSGSGGPGPEPFSRRRASGGLGRASGFHYILIFGFLFSLYVQKSLTLNL